jgi:two-component system, cell cycle sensor histidine kinase and response regulator CckA
VPHAQSESRITPQALSIVPCRDQAPASGTILLVEDEAFLRDATGDVLESAGYWVLKTRNAVEAMSAFRRYRGIVSLLLTDVVLPGQNGRDLAASVRIIYPTVKTIFISGYPENAVTKHGLQEDGMFYLPKPFSAESLTRKIRQVLEE